MFHAPSPIRLHGIHNIGLLAACLICGNRNYAKIITTFISSSINKIGFPCFHHIVTLSRCSIAILSAAAQFYGSYPPFTCNKHGKMWKNLHKHR